MNISEYSVKRPVTTLMVFVCLIVLGLISVTRLPLALLPTVDFPEMSINIPSPNSIPTQVEKQITRPVEEVLSTMSGIKRIRSWSSSNNASIGLQFEWGRDINVLLLEAKEKIDRIKDELPDDIGDIRIQTWSSTDIPIIEGRISSGRDLSEDYDLLEKKIIKPLERIEGVAKVEMNGVAPKQIDINLKLVKLRQHRINGGELFRRLQNSNFTQVLGHVKDGNYRYNVRTVGDFRSVETLESLVVTQQGLQLKDIADVTYEEPSLSWGRHLDREYAIAVEVYKESNANTVDTATKVKAKIAEINKDPTMKGVNFLIFDDQSEQIIDGLEGLLEAGLIGGLLAILVLYFFLRRIGTTLMVSTSIPFSILATCSIIYLKGETLNLLNMMGLMLAVGMLVDNAVVVFESIFRHQQKSEDPATAAITGSKEVITAVIASTLTSIIVFMPFVVLSTGSSLFVWLGVIATAICLTLAASLFISLTLIPMMSSKLHSKKVVKESRLLRKILEKYLITLNWTFRHWILSFVFIIIAFIVTIAVPFQLMNKNFNSGNRTRSLRIEYHFLDNFNDELVEKQVNKIEDYIFAHKEEFEVRSVYSWYSNNQAQTRIYLTSDDFSDKYIRELQNRIREGLPELAGVELTMGAQGGGGTNWLGVNLFGDDSLVLNKVAKEAKRRIAVIDNVNEVETDSQRGKEEIQVTVRRPAAKAYGITPQSVANTLGIILRGRELKKFKTDHGEVAVWLKLREEDRQNIEALKRMPFQTAHGDFIPLSAVANFQIVKGPNVIKRENRITSSSVYAAYEGEDSGKIKAKVTKTMNSMVLPPGYSWSYSHWTQQADENQKYMIIFLLLALVLVYIVMASLFESLAHPFSIMFSLPFGFVGVCWFLFLTNTPLNLMSMIGLLILIGIVVNNGIVLIDHVNNLRRKGMERDEAIIEGCKERFRPILMTALTTILGILPLAVGKANIGGWTYYFPLARTVMGGLASATVLTLIIVPTIYRFVDNFAEGLKKVWARSSV